MSEVNLYVVLRACYEFVVGYVWHVSSLVICCKSLARLFSFPLSFFAEWTALRCPVLSCVAKRKGREKGRLESAGLGEWHLSGETAEVDLRSRSLVFPCLILHVLAFCVVVTAYDDWAAGLLLSFL